jgi:hypothetical protein
MKKSIFVQFFGNGDGAKSSNPVQPQTKRVETTQNSQPNVMRNRMNEGSAGEPTLSYGGTAVADLPNVRLQRSNGFREIFFCQMGQIEVKERIHDGNGCEIDGLEVVIEGLDVPENLADGYYILKGVSVHSNGKVVIKKTEKTAWEKVTA